MMMSRIALFVVACCIFSGTLGLTGVDLSELCTVDGFKCIYNTGVRFAVIRAWMATGGPDPEGIETINNAWAGGMESVDAYLFPCWSCGDPAGQVQKAVAHLSGTKYGRLWFDIEGNGTYWAGGPENNAYFFYSMVTEALSLGVEIGVYTSGYTWIPIMGGYMGGSPFPLWYASYNGQASFDDFYPFGNWTQPVIKQYQGTTNLCGCGVDYNWRPDN